MQARFLRQTGWNEEGMSMRRWSETGSEIRWRLVTTMLVVCLGWLGISVALADPDFSNATDILNERRHSLRTDYAVWTLTFTHLPSGDMVRETAPLTWQTLVRRSQRFARG